MSYDVSVVLIVDGRLDLWSDAVTANQDPSNVTINTTDARHVVTVSYDWLNSSVHAVNNITVISQVSVRTPAGATLQSFAFVTWDSSPLDDPSPYSGRKMALPPDSFPFHMARVMNLSSAIVRGTSELIDSAAIGEQVTLVLEIYLRAEGPYDMNVTLNVTDLEGPGLSTKRLVALPLLGVSLSHAGYNRSLWCVMLS